MLTAREEENDKILGLDLGADDYMTKPFSLGELTSRIRANIRRFSGETVVKQQEDKENAIIYVEDLEIDTDSYTVKKNGQEISLSKQQYELLCFLAKNRGKKFRQDALLEAVWGYDDYYGDVRTVDVTVARLRKQIEENPSEPKYIKNKRGMGYYID
jgi:two-component system response regulator VicR